MSYYNPDAVLNVRQGKVRDVLETKEHILLVATDRISAFDVVMPDEIEGKGKLLRKLSHFWFDYFSQIPNHLTDLSTNLYKEIFYDDWSHMSRISTCKKAKVIPIEFVVRGYITGSLWKEYKNEWDKLNKDRGRGPDSKWLIPPELYGIMFDRNLKQCDEITYYDGPTANHPLVTQPIFTPATKAELGEHDENISFDKSVDICEKFLGWSKDAARQLMKELRNRSINIYKEARTHAVTRGIIIADTKFEYGIIEEDGRKQVVLIDELLTPDSSRFWSLEDYETGRDQDSYDKQILRNYLQELVDKGQWDKKAPGPSLPYKLQNKILARYQEIVERLI